MVVLGILRSLRPRSKELKALPNQITGVKEAYHALLNVHRFTWVMERHRVKKHWCIMHRQKYVNRLYPPA